ncbi:tRNA pseudouridine(38-40) synthase TruA [Desulforhopalus vacuolatus]|uniref:tRNA pseudouridine(38-40) synthase TruA n=1 Tax=Desulforhopalus vacuolatus TaxID=40414 RepID=UPI0019641137|nr:tRNA pseudouridine(38-40) synthase TruA [Desulforhopalus vacuolatus]MBM9518678.1 tRNA pseudouridine(38-40) synthase TruA [Desulforhopalus vacuolatus]
MTELQLRRIRLTIAYDGTRYCGWQRQKNGRSIQQEIETCLRTMTRTEINLHGAGRTDAGVHAESMTAHFDCTSGITNARFLYGLNSMLAGDIRILTVETCPAEFHARFSAKGKCYQYHLCTALIQPPTRRLYSLHVTAALDLSSISRCLGVLEGEHDFESFENTGTRDKRIVTGRGAVRTINSARIFTADSTHLIFEFIGDGFLKNMVRNLMGTLLDAGRGKISSADFAKILQAKDRSAAGVTAPAHALFLKKVFY